MIVDFDVFARFGYCVNWWVVAVTCFYAVMGFGVGRRPCGFW